MRNQFKTSGFYDWSGIRYFLYEYEMYLQSSSKTNKKKIDWDEYIKEQDDFVTIEHILPQTPKDSCWTDVLRGLTKKQKNYVTDSLGNLLPLSRPKNSSLQNKCFQNKIDSDVNQVGYRYGSYSENQVSKNDSWTIRHIKERGLKMLLFMEKRWNFDFGDESQKLEFLNIGFKIKK
jgi:hypothetical protein